MRVLLIWPKPERLTGISVRYERYVRGFRSLGHEPVTVCLPGAAVGYGEPVVLAPDEMALRDPMFYRELGGEAAVLISWLGYSEVVAAAKAGCGWVATLADSDGKIGVRIHPGATFARMVGQHANWGTKLRAAKYWLRLFVTGPGQQDQPMLDSACHADRVIVCSSAAGGHLKRFFASNRRPDLAAKVNAVPYPVDECYLNGAIATHREDRVVAIGRWDDPQKDAGLLCGSIELFYKAGGRSEFHLYGPHGERWFTALARKWPKVIYRGICPPEAIADCLQRSRALVLPSRWESGPIAMYEALASGCTVISSDAIPAAIAVCEEGGFGSVSRGRSAARLADALRREVMAWDSGERDPLKIASLWRPRFEPAAVCRSLLSGCPIEVNV